MNRCCCGGAEWLQRSAPVSGEKPSVAPAIKKCTFFFFFCSNGAVGDGGGGGEAGGIKWEQLLCASSDLIPLKLREAAMETSDDVVAATEDSGS